MRVKGMEVKEWVCLESSRLADEGVLAVVCRYCNAKRGGGAVGAGRLELEWTYVYVCDGTVVRQVGKVP